MINLGGKRSKRLDKIQRLKKAKNIKKNIITNIVISIVLVTVLTSLTLIKSPFNFDRKDKLENKIFTTDTTGYVEPDIRILEIEPADAFRLTNYTSTKIEAENYTSMSGVNVENCSDTNGGKNIGNTDDNDYMIYNVNIPATGTYKVEYRVASPWNSGEIYLKDISASTSLSPINVAATGGWQSWKTISQEVDLSAGQKQIKLNVKKGGFNLNWIKFTQVSQVERVTVESDKVEIVHLTMGEFIGKTEKLNGYYDAVVIGNYVNSGINDEYEFDGYSKSDGYSFDNDITDLKSKELRDFILSGQLVYIDKGITEQSSPDTNGRIVKLFANTKNANSLGLTKDNYITGQQLNNNDDFNITNIVAKYNELKVAKKINLRPKITTNTLATDSDTDLLGDRAKRNMTFNIKAKDLNGDEAVDIKLYLDINGDGVYQEEELFNTIVDAKIDTTKGYNFSYDMFRDMPDFVGYLDWKIIIIKKNNTPNVVGYCTGNVLFRRLTTEKRILNVLQVSPYTQAEITADKNKTILTNNATFNTLINSLKDYTINITTVSINDFYNGDYLGPGHQSLVDSNYNLIIMGFGDSYFGYKDAFNPSKMSDEAITQLNAYIAKGQGLMLTHDTIYKGNITSSSGSTSGGTVPTANYTVTYEIVKTWSYGATINIKIKNNTSTPINDWNLGFALPSGQTIDGTPWNASTTQSNGNLVFKGGTYNSIIAPNATVEFGYNIKSTTENTPSQKASTFTLNTGSTVTATTSSTTEQTIPTSDYSVNYKKNQDNGTSGANYTATITNSSSNNITNWKFEMTLPSNISLSGGYWNGFTYTTNGNIVTVTSTTNNPIIKGTSVEFGFDITGGTQIGTVQNVLKTLVQTQTPTPTPTGNNKMLVNFKDYAGLSRYNSSSDVPINFNVPASSQIQLQSYQTYDVDGKSIITHDSAINNNNKDGYSFWQINDPNCVKSNSTKVYLTNETLVTKYPYDLTKDDSGNKRDTMTVRRTHAQYYQLNLEEEDVVLNFTLTNYNYTDVSGTNILPNGDNNNGYKRASYADKYDVRNNFYTFSRGSITFSGTGEDGRQDSYGVDELKLFVNTIIKAERGANHKPIVTGLNEGQQISAATDLVFNAIVKDIDKGDTVKINNITVDGVNTGIKINSADISSIINSTTLYKSPYTPSVIIPKSLFAGKTTTKIIIEAQDSRGAKVIKEYNLNVSNIGVSAITHGLYNGLKESPRINTSNNLEFTKDVIINFAANFSIENCTNMNIDLSLDSKLLPTTNLDIFNMDNNKNDIRVYKVINNALEPCKNVIISKVNSQYNITVGEAITDKTEILILYTAKTPANSNNETFTNKIKVYDKNQDFIFKTGDPNVTLPDLF